MAENILAKMAIELSAKTTDFNKSLSGAEKTLNGFQKTATGTANLIKGALAGISIATLGKEIISVASDFQKFEAVLKNTLGSQSAAKIAMRDIENFAKTTPFAVDELTASFVKLANQGFAPNADELRKLGDLASSTGKNFDQLAEAVLDAQTGEFERLKEFGIRARKEGDNVSFSFKGVETQTLNTSKAIREYILSLGDIEGVAGSMAAISETLGGKISNLGDSWTQFLKVIGDGNKGVMSGSVILLGKLLDFATEHLKTARQIQEELEVDSQSKIVEELKDMERITGDVESASVKLISRLEEERTAISELAAPLFKNFEENEKQIETYNNQAKAIDAQIQAVKDYTAAQIKAAAAERAANEEKRKAVGLILNVEKALRDIELQRRRSFSTEEIAKFNKEMDELREKLELFNASRPLTKFAQDLKGFVANGVNQLPEFDLKLKQPDFDGVSQDQAQIQPPDFTKFQEAFAIIQQGYKDTGQIAYYATEQSNLAWDLQVEKQKQAIAMAEEYGSTFGRIIGESIAGQESLADTMKRITRELLATFLSRAVGAAISSSFQSSGNPVIGAALAAASSALIVGMFSKIGGGSGGKGNVSGSLSSASRSTVSRNSKTASGDEIKFNANFKISGPDLKATADTQDYKKSRLG